MSSQAERWVVWNDSPHHYCHDDSLFADLAMDFPPPDLTKPIAVFGQADIFIPIQDHPRITSIRLRNVCYYKADGGEKLCQLEDAAGRVSEASSAGDRRI
ncbi:hypothetical protein H2200_007100 [Cladophialophora chaetospira]|uniref:Uncharacterized protein n=1 Tax=Cladophialophora chaetospira TaxID=386627 RepID=A0AA39CH73_9EURO|nr:hypothetical protein H2200_007100 [Cladophialophora chaetospira]